MNKLYALLLLFCVLNIGLVSAQPDNDNCEDAIEVGYGTHDYSSLGATTDGPEHANCTGFSFGDDNCHLDMWYEVTAENDGFIELSTCDMIDYDSRLVVYNPDWDCPPVEEDLLACNDDGAGCAGFSSFLNFPVVAGETYLVRIGGYSAGDSGSGTFSLTEIIPPNPAANTFCNLAQNVPVLTSSQANDDDTFTLGNNENSPSNTTEPTCRPFGEFYDVWFRFNTGTNEELDVVFEPLNPEAQFIFEIWDGDCSATSLPIDSVGGTLSPQTCWDETLTPDFEWTIEGFSGTPTEYLVRVSTYVTGQIPGEFQFQLIGDEPTVVTGIEEITEVEFSVFPNPSNGQFIINTNVNVKNGSLNVMDLQGRIIHSQNLNLRNNTNNEVSIPDATTGIYFLNINDSNGNSILNRKIIVE
ncbi:MAG: hypothetical protein ACI8XB_001615 [Patiriisocius sp.]|jgi:hypothetical protein